MTLGFGCCNHLFHGSECRRSITLRWTLAGVGVIDGHPLPPGDALARLERWIAATGEALHGVDDPGPIGKEPGPRGPVGENWSVVALDLLPDLLSGTELAVARLIVASFDPDLDQVAHQAAHA